MEKGGSKCSNPKSGGLEQLVTNLRKAARSRSSKSFTSEIAIRIDQVPTLNESAFRDNVKELTYYVGFFRPFKRTLPRHDQNFEDIFYNQCMTSAMSEYLFSFEAIKVEKNMAVKGKGQKPKNEVKSKKYQTFRGDMLQLKESRAILLH